MTWAEAYALWQRLDGSIWFGVAVYPYLSRRRIQERLDLAAEAVRDQETTIRGLLVATGLSGVDLHRVRRRMRLLLTDDEDSTEARH